MSSDIMSPVAVTDIRSSCCEIRQISQGLPCRIHITGESYLIAVAADTSPTVIYHRSRSLKAKRLSLTHLVIEEGIIQPECIAQVLDISRLLPLLPVKPPEIHSLTVKRTDHSLEICISPVCLRDGNCKNGN